MERITAPGRSATIATTTGVTGNTIATSTDSVLI
jgi:hypothetical protein